MIIYQGIKTRNKRYILCLSNDKKSQIEIPIDESTAKRIATYLEYFCDKIPQPDVERSSDVLIEE